MSRHPMQTLAQPFSWVPTELSGDQNASFIADAMDAWRGVETCLDLVNSSELDRLHNAEAVPGDETTQLLGVAETERLLRLAIVTARTWSDKCEHHLAWMERQSARPLNKGGANELDN